MTTITALTFQSLDGVTQGPGGPSEDRDGGFERGGWVAAGFDEDGGGFVAETFGKAGAFLLGRRTYDIFSGFWPDHDDADDPVAGRLNRLPKYVASTTLRDPSWAETSVLDGGPDRLADQVREVRDATTDGELQVHGSVRLTQWLLAQGLLDEHRVLTFPVVVGGGGRRLFAADAPATAMRLTGSRATPAGVVVSTYRPAGPADLRDING